MIHKQVTKFLFLSLLICAFFTCSENSNQNISDKKITIKMITHGQATDPFWSVVRNGAKDAAQKVIAGDPKNDSTTIGPLVSDVQFKKVQNLIQKGIDEGAELLIGGTGKPDGLEKGYYAKPTVFADVKNDMAISREEIFGPVLSMLTYKNIDDAVAIANDTEYGLAAYVSGEDKETLTSIARRLRAGQIHVNYGSGGADAPFGGYKQSGNGREKAEWGLEEFLEVKAIMGA